MIEEQNKLISHSPEETLAFGRKIARNFKSGDVVCLYGDLGAGKTHLVKGIASSFGLDENEVQSPTFTIINEYRAITPVYHFDFYRINSFKEALEIGVEEYFYGDGICLIEWPEKIAEIIPEQAIHIYLKHQSGNDREIFVTIG
ncbi:MAG: tRNA (adenosine(37)-N6)-threonylcarbamoyltransferase complex ATPase subunit type 1 TsaE [Balneolales bacterium]